MIEPLLGGRKRRRKRYTMISADPVAISVHTIPTDTDLSAANVVNAPAGIFGVPLHESIIYANVAISLTNEAGESFIYGYVPIVVAKCGVFLKEKGKISP